MPKASAKLTWKKTVGKPVETVPQIFVDQKHIGGCTDLKPWAKENLGLFALSQFICSMNDCARYQARRR
ncbi:glutaredoxin 1 [Klebsiella pneumoniae]|uniref:Glutaredoxin 1 n=1 Tax=Klebsiella pneumoniae TaxID=573 RepID=A0A377TR53_KLEPN|nr:glutaredoxin 1 [Klebsiella pneumoniae]